MSIKKIFEKYTSEEIADALVFPIKRQPDNSGKPINNWPNTAKSGDRK